MLRPASILLVGALLTTSPGALANHWGDDWSASLLQAYTRPNGDIVLLEVTWKTWSPWPTPPAASMDRMHDLHAYVTYVNGPSLELANPVIDFDPVSGSFPTQDVNVTADGLAWHTVWTWELWEGCGITEMVAWRPAEELERRAPTIAGYVGQLGLAEANAATATVLEAGLVGLYAAGGSSSFVRGDLEDASGATDLFGEPLQPLLFLESSSGDAGSFGVSGHGYAQETGPGPDGYWDCYPGNSPV